MSIGAPRARAEGGAPAAARLARFDPLRIGGTALPPQVLLACKLVVLSLMARGYVSKLPEPFLPMLRVFDLFPRGGFRLALMGAFVVAGLALLFNVRVRASAFVAGLVFLLEPLVSRVDFYYGNFFCGAILFLASLVHSPLGVRLVQAQFLVMYFGSGLNKLLDPDWRSGHYFQYWMSGRSPRYDLLAEALSPETLAAFMSWATIAVELSLPLLLARRASVRAGLWLAISFHVGSMLIAGGDFGIFVSALLFSMVVFGRWPAPGGARLVHGGGAAWRRVQALGRLVDRDGFVRWETKPKARAELSWNGERYRGLAAFHVWLLLQPATYLAYLLLLTTPRVSWNLGRELAGRGWGWFAEDRLFVWHRALVEAVTVGLLVWLAPPVRALLDRLFGQRDR